AETAAMTATQAQQATQKALEQREYTLFLTSLTLADRDWWANRVDLAERWLDQCPPGRRHWEWDYLNRLCRAGCLTLRGHPNEIYSLAFSTDGTRLATASRGVRKVWAVDTGKELFSIRTQDQYPSTVSFSPDGQRLATALDQTAVGVWETS